MQRLSIITVCRNCADALRSTIESVAQQDYPDIEYVVIDGASTDETADIVRTSRAIDIRLSEPDRGIYDAMNKGTRLATGEWIIFMNAGDRFAAPDTASRLMQSIAEGDDVVYGSVIKLAPDGTPVTYPAAEPRNSHRMIFCHQSVMCRRELLLKYPFDITHRLSADFKFFKTLMRAGAQFHRTDIPVAIFDTGGVSNTRRSAGLADNMRVILETDGPLHGARFILHLLPTYIIAKLRGK